MAPRLRQVISQTKAQMFDGTTRTEGKLLNKFEPSTEFNRKVGGKKPTNSEMLRLQAAEIGL